MRVFLQDYYLKDFGWIFFKEAIEEGSLNLSLYFDRYINKNALIESPNKAKSFSLSLLRNYNLIEKLVSYLDDLIKTVKINGQDNHKKDVRKSDVLKDLENIRNLIENGEIFGIDLKKIDDAKKLYYKNYSQIKSDLDNIISSIKDALNRIQKCEVFEAHIAENTRKEYEYFFNNLLQELWSDLKYVELFKLKTKSRLVVGLGDESVYETSIRLNRNYGVPYIPGSALKGVAKHYAIYRLVDELRSKTFDDEVDFFKLAGIIQQKFEEPDDSKIESLRNLTFKLNDEEVSFEELRKIFGTQRYEGSIIFFDAFPIPDEIGQNPILELDIMNPHYQPYYQNNEPPGDWHNPNPIFFLTVPEGIVFQFAIAPRDERGVCLLDKARDILISALEEFGVGAKTALGYGRFKRSNSKDSKNQTNQQKP